MTWLDKGRFLATEESRGSLKNPFTLESSALDAFSLSQYDTKLERKAVDTQEMAAEMVTSIMNFQTSYALGGGNVNRFVLGISERQDAWDEWPNTGTRNKTLVLFGNSLAFTPSILSICVGISAVIVLSNFVYQLSWAVENTNIIHDFLRVIKNLNFFVQSVVNVASCIDSAQLKTIQTVGLSAIIKQLSNWPPIASEIIRMSQRLNITTNMSATEYEIIKQYLLLPSLTNILSNETQILYDLPVFGSTLQCFSSLGSSDEFKSLFNQSDTRNSENAIPQIHQSKDTCR
jgi:hypothetical protein